LTRHIDPGEPEIQAIEAQKRRFLAVRGKAWHDACGFREKGSSLEALELAGPLEAQPIAMRLTSTWAASPRRTAMSCFRETRRA
jgi:hypothetical protein